MLRKINRYVPAASMAVFALTALCAVFHFLFYRLPAFSDFFNKYIGGSFRFTLAKITDPLPFSVAEALMYSALLIIVVACVLLTRYAKHGKKETVRVFTGLLSCVAAVYCMFVIGFASGYRGTTLAEKTGLSDREVSADELFATANTVIDSLNAEADSVDFISGGKSVMPWEISGMSRELCACYKTAAGKYSFVNGFSSDVKPLIISPYMTYTHLSGIYSFFTGEANLNTNYPDYVCVFTAAHEMAHQRGISKEDEANFVAFLVCKDSDDSYVRYSAYLNMYSYLATALYQADPDLYSKAYASLDSRIKDELAAYSVFFDKYRDNKASEISDSFNDAYLKSQGTAGVASYGMVADLAVSYYLD